MSNKRPENVGIKAIDFVFPKLYVDQTELEEFDGVSAGKYTIGLGQKQMGFCSEIEDINSLCLTVFNRLMERYGLRYEDIGYLEVGTETSVDKSKCVKTVLMDLFEQSGNFKVDGVSVMNACYGGTAALFNAVNWVKSDDWDGRLAVIVAGDIALYAKGSARPTGGAGAVAMLVGPNASLVIDRGSKSTYMRNTWDFYKPVSKSEYPVVDGVLSIECYLAALDNCYQSYANNKDAEFEVNRFDAFVFHSPYCKLVQKSLARVVLNDYVRCADKKNRFPGLERFENVVLEKSYFDKDVEKAFLKQSETAFEKMTKPSLMLASRVGNMYTASVYGCLVSYLITTPLAELPGKKIAVFSYGSGLASSLYSITVREGDELTSIVKKCDRVKRQLDERCKVSPQEFTNILEQREGSLHKAPFASQRPTDELFPGTWYLESIDDKYRRTYSRTS